MKYKLTILLMLVSVYCSPEGGSKKASDMPVVACMNMDKKSIEEAKTLYQTTLKDFINHIKIKKNISGKREMINEQRFHYIDESRNIKIMLSDPEKFDKADRMLDYDQILYILEHGTISFCEGETRLSCATISVDNPLFPVLMFGYDCMDKKWELEYIETSSMGISKPQ